MPGSSPPACGLWRFLLRVRRVSSHGYRPVSGPYTPHGGSCPLDGCQIKILNPRFLRAGRGAVRGGSGLQTGVACCKRYFSNTSVRFFPVLCPGLPGNTQSEAIPADDFSGAGLCHPPAQARVFEVWWWFLV